MPPGSGQKGVVPLELLFDLVFAFAVSQLSDHLLNHLTWRGVAETLVMLLAILMVWSYTSWVAIILGPEHSKTRWMMLIVMLPALFLNASVTKAFTLYGWTFATPLLLIQLGRIAWTLLNAPDQFYREHYYRVLIWFTLATPFWVIGTVEGSEARLAWWSAAVGIDLVGTWLAHPIPGRKLRSVNVPFDADHMLDRCRQFVIIALGETVVRTGTAIAGAPETGMTLATGLSALVGTVALWALSFGSTHRQVMRHLDKSKDPIRTSRYAVNANMGIIAGLIAVAVGNKVVIANPEGPTSWALSLLLAGGPILFLASQGWYLWLVPKVRPRLHWIGGLGLFLAGLVTQALPTYGALILVGSWLMILAIADEKIVPLRGGHH